MSNWLEHCSVSLGTSESRIALRRFQTQETVLTSGITLVQSWALSPLLLAQSAHDMSPLNMMDENSVLSLQESISSNESLRKKPLIYKSSSRYCGSLDQRQFKKGRNGHWTIYNSTQSVSSLWARTTVVPIAKILKVANWSSRSMFERFYYRSVSVQQPFSNQRTLAGKLLVLNIPLVSTVPCIQNLHNTIHRFPEDKVY